MRSQNPLKGFLVAGISLLIVGFGTNMTSITPIIKPIATSSFVLASLGYCLLIITGFNWWIDVRMHRKLLLFFQVLDMNSIFIYLLFDIVGRNWLNGYTFMIVHPLFACLGLGELSIKILPSLCVFLLKWFICYFLYKKKIFLKSNYRVRDNSNE